ncbi:Peptidase family M50 [Phycisphaerae bacterium RAS2]|nr:Peptidase family M50 [Phycisphaerae bacterium RAS2]
MDSALLAAVEFTPLMIAALIGWIISVCFHEFSHALVAYWGGDTSTAERGYLTFNPAKYIDPLFSLAIPAAVFMLGGFPLPGGAVLIDYSRLRSDKWGSYVSAAGPASNFVLFLLTAFIFHPALGIVDVTTYDQPNWVYFCGAMAVLNFIAVVFNLIPLPPFDGFGIIEHKLSNESRWRMRMPQTSLACIALAFFGFGLEPVQRFVWGGFDQLCSMLGLPTDLLAVCFQVVLFNEAPPTA